MTMTDNSPTCLYTGTRRPNVDVGLNLVHKPLLVVEPIDVDKTAIREELSSADWVVLYSRNAVDISKALKLFESSSENLSAFAVGPKTANYIESELQLEATYPELDHHFDGVVELIREKRNDGTIVSLELQGKSHCLEDQLEHDVESFDIYRSRPAKKEHFDDLEKYLPGAIALTSPKSVERLSEISPTNLDKFKLGAIGPKTANAIDQHFRIPDVVLDKPNKEHLVEKLSAIFLK